MKPLTRRNLFTAAAALPLAAFGQEKPTAPNDDLASARESIASNAAQLAKVEIPIATEPAFVFKA